MKAAVVHSFGVPPSFADFVEPETGTNETVVQVRAAPLSPIVKRLAAGTHYASSNTAGFVPGVDGVGVDSAGRRVYFLFPKAPFGSLAEKSLVSNEMMVPIPASLSDVQAAAIATAGLASWIALTRRAKLSQGETVLINGATGSAGSMAVQTARHLGAARVIAAGRNRGKLERLNADAKIVFGEDGDQSLRAEFDRGVDVVLDFLWGEPAGRVLNAAAKDRGSRGGEPRLRYVQLGTVAGEEISLKGDILRSSGLELIGSGIGSVSVKDLLTGAGELLDAAPVAGFYAPVVSLPLEALAQAWDGDPNIRYILLPSPEATV